MPTLHKSIIQAHEPNPQLLETLLHTIKFPRCCVCDLGWFEEWLDDEENNDVVAIESSSNSKEKDSNKDAYKHKLMKKCKDLIPLPRCSCTTTLMKYEYTSEEYNQILEETRTSVIGNDYSQIRELLIEKFCHDDNFEKYCHTAMCQQCLYTFVSSSQDVIEHDYMSETQPNIKFSVGGKCPCCRRKFTARSLNSLVQSVKTNIDDHDKKASGDNRVMLEWVEHNVNTIVFIKFAKQLKKILASVGEINVMTHESVQPQNIIERWIHDDTEEHLSDDCFSDHDEMGSASMAYPRSGKNQGRVGIRMIAPDEGEIRQHLLEKDPKFRQECEDLEYIQKMSSTLEGRRALGIESPPSKCELPNKQQLEKDEELARKLECELNGQNVNKNKNKNKSPLLKYFATVGQSMIAASQKLMTPGTMKKDVDRSCRKRKQEKITSMERFIQSSRMKGSSLDINGTLSDQMEPQTTHIEFKDSPFIDSKSKETEFPIEKQPKETIVIFNSDDDEEKKCGFNDSMMKCSPSTTNLDIFMREPPLRSTNRSTEEPNIDESKCHDDDEDLPLILSSSTASDIKMAAQKTILNEDPINNMISIGFSRHECVEALQDAENNWELAVNLLLDRNKRRV